MFMGTKIMDPTVFCQLAANATTPESVQQLAAAICNITSGTTEATRETFLSTPQIFPAFCQLAANATTESVLRLTGAICNITRGTTQETVVSAFSQLAANAKTPGSIRWVIFVIYDISCEAVKDVAVLVPVFSQLTDNATSESVQQLADAICSIIIEATQ